MTTIREPEKDRERERRSMIETIERETRMTAGFTGREELDPRILTAMHRVAREDFVETGQKVNAYLNSPLPIGYGQTISQPFIVALMTDLLEPRADDIILEIGTGSGYQAAVLSCLVRKVYSIELVPELADRAAKRLASLSYDNVEVKAGDGNLGWSEHAPFDGIIVTAAGPSVPRALIDQLAVGRRLVIPVGSPFSQELQCLSKNQKDQIDVENILPVSFVPLRSGSARF
jgi:protein-L-isoaspartate(D-aspartate) O-methyltransferase